MLKLSWQLGIYRKYFNCNTDNILQFHVNFQQHSVAFIRLLPQYYNKIDKQRAIESAPEELRPKLWKRYVDDTLEVIKRGKVEEWSTHLNSMDPTGSIKFTYEEETNNTIPFLNTLLERRPDGSVKVQVYRKKTHTNQYLAFTSRSPFTSENGSGENVVKQV